MQRISLEALARQQLDAARRAGGCHTADTVYGGRENVRHSRGALEDSAVLFTVAKLP